MLFGSALRENLGNDEIECVIFFLKVEDICCLCKVCVRFELAVVVPCYMAANYMICLLIGGLLLRLLFLLSAVITPALRRRPLRFLVVWLYCRNKLLSTPSQPSWSSLMKLFARYS